MPYNHSYRVEAREERVEAAAARAEAAAERLEAARRESRVARAARREARAARVEEERREAAPDGEEVANDEADSNEEGHGAEEVEVVQRPQTRSRLKQQDENNINILNPCKDKMNYKSLLLVLLLSTGFAEPKIENLQVDMLTTIMQTPTILAMDSTDPN